MCQIVEMKESMVSFIPPTEKRSSIFGRSRKKIKKELKAIAEIPQGNDAFWENQKDKLLEASTLVLAIASSVLVVLFGVMEIYPAALLAGLGGIVFLFPYYLNSRKKKFWARMLLCLLFVVYFTSFSIYLGKGAGLEYVLIVAAILPALFFDQKKVTISLFLFSLACFALCKISFYYIPLSFPHFAWVYIYDTVLLGVFMLLFLIVNKFKLLFTFHEGTIHTMVDTLQGQHNELTRLHSKLTAQTTAIEKAAIVATTDVKGRITYVNENFTKVSKYTKEEVLGKTHQLINSGYHSDEFFKDLWRTIANGKIWRGEFRNRAKDGSIYWVDSSIIPVLDANGKPYEYLAIRFVITKQKEAEHQLKERNQKITASINYAQRIQAATLPSAERLIQLLPKHFLLFQPKDTVSGDFYWTAQVAHKTVVVAADCTGHGVPGAFMSMIASMLLDRVVNTEQITSPEKILEALHDNICEVLKQKKTGNQDGMDIAICVIDAQEKELAFAGAHNPLVYIQDGELHKVKGDKLAVGGQKRSRASFTKHVLPLERGTKYYLYSDGFQDQFGGLEGKKYMSKRFARLLQSTSDGSLSEQQVALSNELETWKEGYKQTDDVLVIGFSYDDFS